MLIDLSTREARAMYSGTKGGDYAIRAEFGGANEAYVISGSDGKTTSRDVTPCCGSLCAN
jgi:hypothetical protein